MRKLCFVFVICLGFVRPAACQPDMALSDSIREQLRIGVSGFRDRFHSPGIVVVIVHDKDIIFSEAQGYTDLDHKTPASPDARYPVLSLTKTFTATMLMQLVERNKVNLVDDVRKYVPELGSNSNLTGKSATTLLQLATHTAGFPRNSPADIHFTKQVDRWLLSGAAYATIEPATKKEFLSSLKFIRKEYPAYEFLSYGDRHYSNLGYSLLGIALERAAKTDYAKYIADNIFAPLGMKSSGFDSEDLPAGRLATGYYYNDSTKSFVKTPKFLSNSALYAGGMYSSANDLAKFISFQFADDERADSVLSKENRAMMQSFRIGWKPAYPMVLHEGAMLGYRCEIAYHPETKLGWVILTNTTDFEFSGMNNYIGKLLVPVYSKKNVVDLDQYVGTYKLGGGYDSIKITLKDGVLYSSYLQESTGAHPLVASGDHQFKGQTRGRYSVGYSFLRNEEGEIRYLNLGQLMWVKQ